MDTAYQHLETLRKENTQRKVGETVERRTRRLLEGYLLGECVDHGHWSNHGTLWLHNDNDNDDEDDDDDDQSHKTFTEII